jgi:hypothetical protein
MLSWSSLSGGRATQLQSGENNTIFEHLGEIGSELKSDWLKKFNSSLPCGQKGLATAHNQLLAAPLWRIHLHQMTHHTKEKLGSNTLSQFLPKLSKMNGQHSLPHRPTLRRDRDTEKASVKSVSTCI